MTASSSVHASADRLGQAIAGRLSEGCDTLDHDISERLRVARQQAIAHRKAAQPAEIAHIVGEGPTAALQLAGSSEPGRWARLVAAVPLVALLLGLLGLSVLQRDLRAREVAAIDAALLTDALPAAAYTDPGFVQFLQQAGDAPRN